MIDKILLTHRDVERLARYVFSSLGYKEITRGSFVVTGSKYQPDLIFRASTNLLVVVEVKPPWNYDTTSSDREVLTGIGQSALYAGTFQATPYLVLYQKSYARIHQALDFLPHIGVVTYSPEDLLATLIEPVDQSNNRALHVIDLPTEFLIYEGEHKFRRVSQILVQDGLKAQICQSPKGLFFIIGKRTNYCLARARTLEVAKSTLAIYEKELKQHPETESKLAIYLSDRQSALIIPLKEISDAL